MRVHAPAKINLTLDVLGLRDDGFHEVNTVMAAIGLFDVLDFELGNELLFSCSDPSLPVDEGNLVMKAARLLACKRDLGARIHLEKQIPHGAGLGGGSSDAAATLLALNQLWGLGHSLEDLGAMAAVLGSDVSFFLRGGCARCTGRGEKVIPLSFEGPKLFLLVLPGLHISTPPVYAALDSSLTKRGQDPRLSAGLANSSAMFRNDLESVVFQLFPDLCDLHKALMTGPVTDCVLSGSGSAMFATFTDREKVETFMKTLDTVIPLTWLFVETIPPHHGRLLN